jgi:hypothetical protein
MWKEKRREDDRVNKVCEARDIINNHAEPLEILWIARRAFFGLASDCDVMGPYDDPVEYDKMLDIYTEINAIIQKHFGDEAAEEE